MMKSTKKILLALVLTLAMAAVLSVCAFAFDINTDLPKGVTNTSSKWISSGYTDVDTEEGWYMMCSGTSDYSTPDGGFPDFAMLNSSRFYWNKTTGEAVWVALASNLSGDSGEEIVFSGSNPSTDAGKKFYAYATHFIDITNTANNTFKTHFASNTSEKSQYGGRDKTKYPIHESWITGSKAKEQWSSYYVTADAYKDFVALKKELGYAEDATVSNTEHLNTLIEYAYSAVGTYKQLRNCQEAGALYRMAWVFQQLADNGYVFTSLELRAAKNVIPYFGTVGLVTKLIEAKKILFDTKVDKLVFTNTYRGLFISNAALKTFDHVTFKEDGSYDETVTENVIDLTGFTKVKSYGTTVRYFSSMLQTAKGLTDVIFFKTLVNTEDGKDYAGYIDQESFDGCTKLETLTMTAPLTKICSYALRNCYALTTIDLKGGVAAGATVDSTAFNSVNGPITIYVYTASDEARAKAAFAAFSSKITVVNKSLTGAAILSDGYSIRLNDEKAANKGAALRAEFTLLKSTVDAVLADEGATLADYGVVVFSANTLQNVYGGDESALMAALISGEYDAAKIKTVSAKNGPYVAVHDNGDITFAAAVTGIPAGNYTSAVYTYAYAAWTKDEGATVEYTYTTYVSDRTGKSAHSLYDATVYAFRTGVVNSQNFNTGVDLWSILQKGALSVTESETREMNALLTLDKQYTFDGEGKFTYLDLPLRAWNMYKKNGALVWNSRGTSVEDTATTGVLWSILVDGDEYVVAYREAPGFEGESVLPELSDSYGASAPYSANYFRVTEASQVVTDATANGLYKSAKLYSPLVTAENSAKIKALVVDYGIDRFGPKALDDSKRSSRIETIAYPEGMTAGTYLLCGCTYLKNFIYVTADKSYLANYDVENLVDLSGLAKVNMHGITQSASVMENLLLPAKEKVSNGEQYGFNGAKSLVRAWTVGFDMPVAGTLDLSQTNITTICKGYFRDLNSIDEIIMPASFKAVSAYSMATKNQTTDTMRWYLFGDNSQAAQFNIHVFTWEALNCIANTFYEARQNPEYNDGKADDPNGIAHVIDYLEITYEGVTKTVLEWRVDFPAQPSAE